jgi:hypothetical protein
MLHQYGFHGHVTIVALRFKLLLFFGIAKKDNAADTPTLKRT